MSGQVSRGEVARRARQNGCDFRILNAIRQIIRAVDIDSRKLAAQHQVTGPQLMCLLAVVDNGAITSTDVAARVHLDTSTLVGVLDRLEKKGLIRRERSLEDRREVHLTATEAGRKLAAKTPYPMQHTLGEKLKGISASEREQIARGLERLVSLIGADKLDGGPILEITSVAKAVK
jgi:DNA-binding MarR family transcriptional regulator